MERPSWAPADVDVERPSVARVYDHYLGGSHNFAADREFARRVLEVMPSLPLIIRENRAFLRRAVRHLLAAGIHQFIELGSGIPTAGAVHEVAQSIEPTTRVVYVDIDPVAVAHSRAILAGNAHATVVPADLRKPDAVLTEPAVLDLIDLTQPVGVLLVSVLHFVPPEQEPKKIVAGYASAVAAGSQIAISHASTHGRPDEAAGVRELYNREAAPMTMRSQKEIVQLFGDLTLLEPGVVELPRWRPDSDWSGPDEPATDDVDSFPGFAGVGRKD